MIATRAFPSYADYVAKQGGKAVRLREKLLSHMDRATESFTRIFQGAKPHLKDGSILCLGARTGAESLGAEAAGFGRSVGIDLHPVGPTVQQGDWHALDFPDGSFANVYTNSLDHCLYLDQCLSEVKRVLQKHGRFYMMATNRGEKHTSVDVWRADEGSNEGLYWSTSDELAQLIAEHGFTLEQSWRAGKWGHYVFGVTR